jgi:formate dehydrogenase iron-sulfur subunit
MSKSIFVDTTRCTACRGCQVACKEWKLLPATKTRQTGTHQNPPDLNAFTLKVVRFNEKKINGRVVWNFFSDMCRHCVDPPCKETADAVLEGAVIKDQNTGAVLYTEETRKLTADAFEEMKKACPYNIPRRDDSTGLVTKCNMCFDRITNDLLPMCVKTCPTSAMNFGDSAKMAELAAKRLAEVKKQYPDAVLVDENSVSVVYLIAYKPEFYHKYVMARADGGLTRKRAVARLLSPITRSLAGLTG